MRRASPAELAEVREAFEAWGPRLAARLFPRGTTLLVRPSHDGLGLFLASQRAADEAEGCPWPVEYAGLPLGHLIEGEWRPSLEAAQLVPPRAADRSVVVIEEVVGRFLYGRGIEAEGIRRASPEAETGDVVFVFAPNGDALGLGRLVPDKRGRRRLDPIVDLGWYLREGG